jgi:AIPR protein
MASAALDVFSTRTDLEPFGTSGLLLFALQLKFGIDDILTVATTAVTDDTNDQKCDLLYIDDESRTAVLAQGYVAENASKSEAPANKAAGLAAAVSWILGNERPADLGPSLRSAAEDLHNALFAGEIDTIELWYCHNLPESKNVQAQLERAANAARALLKQHYPDTTIDVRYLEVGRSVLDEWYRSTETPILVTEDLEVPSTDWYSESGDGWEAVCTSVPAAWLHDLYDRFGDKLFSANVRGYMPSRRTAQNINYGMEKTAKNAPGRFWAFNNGVTALVSGMQANGRRRKTLRVSGIAVVNGAQTTGALAKVDTRALEGANVMIRFVKAANADIINDIIRYNNSQNPIKPSDFRSGDLHQDRLRKEFQSIPDATYLGARRGGQEDRARRPSNLISSDTAAQALAAFHEEPDVAYHELRSIWERDELYSRFFSDHTSAAHIVYCYSLLRIIQRIKLDLSSKDQPTRDDQEALDYLRRRGSSFLLTAAIAACSEVYLGRAIPSTYLLSFGTTTSPAVAAEYWSPLVETLLPFAPGQLAPVFDNGGLRRKDNVASALSNFRAPVSSTRKANASVFDDFRAHVVASS